MNSLPKLIGRARTLMTDGASLGEAVSELHAEIGGDPEALAQWWDALGPTALERILSPHVQQRERSRASAGPRNLPAPRPSWRSSLTADSALDMELPVGGGRKRVRDFTPRDIDSLVATYRGLVDAVTAKAEKWARLKRAMRADDTIASALEAGRLKATSVEFIGAPNSELLTSGAA